VRSDAGSAVVTSAHRRAFSGTPNNSIARVGSSAEMSGRHATIAAAAATGNNCADTVKWRVEKMVVNRT
jgi:hypothetical protein